MGADPVKPEWRTPDVVGLCRAVRETGDYALTPILADALQEAGADSDPYGNRLLAGLRSPRSRTEAQRLVALVYSVETERAVRHLEDLAESMGESFFPCDCGVMTYEKFVDAVTSFVRTGYDGLGDGSMEWSNATCDQGFDDFWPHFTLVTGLGKPDDTHDLFACSC